MASVANLMTVEELLAMPDDGVERWLINGELREHRVSIQSLLGGEPRERPMTIRNRFHSRIVIRLGRLLDEWLDQQSPRGTVVGGEAGIRLCRDPDTVVGVDVAYISPEVLARQNTDTTLVEGVPTLVAEVLSPNDTIEAIYEKIDLYRNTRVPLVWILDPYHKTVTTYRPNKEPTMVTSGEELIGDPELPGFRVRVSMVFE